jgi:hypothetical protein
MEIEYKIVETPEYTLAISDEKIRNGDLCYDSLRKCITKKTDKITCNGEIYKKIIAHLPKGNAKELDLPLLPQMIVEDDVEKLISKHIKDFKHDLKESTSTYIKQNCEGAIFGLNRLKEGYKTATKKYTEKDLEKAILIAKEYTLGKGHDYTVEEILHFFKFPKTPNAFVAKMEEVCKPMPNIHVKTWELKTTINSKGQKVLVGKYKYY